MTRNYLSADGLALDVRHLIRSLRRSPAFMAIVVATLAVGLGITTTVASVVDHVLVRGLPFRDSGRLMMMLERDQHGAFRTPSALTSLDWERDPGVAAAFDGVTFIPGDGTTLQVGAASEQGVGCAYVDSTFFALLGTRAVVGRLLTADDHRRDAPAAVVISYKLWLRKFGGDPSAVGRTVRIDSVPATVVGVLPNGAVYPPFADLWLSLSRYRHPEILARRGGHADSRTMGRLRAGVDSARAMTLMSTVGARLASEYPAEQAGWMPAMIPMQLEIVGNVRPMLLTLDAAAAAVLLLVCANVASLLLARATTRTRELALRRALGASRARMMRQLLSETFALSLFGGVLGTALAVLGVVLTRKLVGGRLPRVSELTVDWRVLAIAALATVVTGLLCGLWPAIRSSGERAMDVLRASAHGSVGVKSDARLRRLLVITQFALALVLLVGSGLLLQSFRRAAAVNVGFDPSGVVTVRIRPPSGYGKPSEAAALYQRLMVAARAVPGVTDAAFINHVPFGPASVYTTVSIPGRAMLDSSNQIFYRTVSASYLATMRMSMKAGRWFDDADVRSPGGSFIVNETTANLYWPGRSAVGERLTVTRASQGRADFGQPLTGTIVGVVANVHQVGQDVLPSAEVYVPYTLETWPWGMLVVRARDGARSIPALARAVRSVEPRLIEAGSAGEDAFGVMQNEIASSLEPRRVSMSLVASFALCALVLAAIGMYGVVSYTIAQRTQEIGVRKALGARDADVAWLVFRDSLRIVAFGVALGVAGAWAGARLIRSLLFDTGVADPATYVATVVVLAGVAMVATFMPARHAARLDPTIAMRAD